jgi:hypothetical protein
MNKIFTVSSLLFFFCSTLPAQDTIALKIGISVPAKVIRVNDTVVYRLWGSKISGPVSLFMTYQVRYIRYSDGTIQSFESQTKPASFQILMKAGVAISNENSILGGSYGVIGFSGSAGVLSKALGAKKRFRLEGCLSDIQKGGSVLTLQGVSASILNTYNGEPDLLHLNYLQADVSIRYYPIHFLYIKAGVTGTYLVGFSTNNPDAYHKSDINPVAVGVQGGIGISRTGKKAGIFTELIYQSDITPIGLQQMNGGDYRNTSLMFNVGVNINLTGK